MSAEYVDGTIDKSLEQKPEIKDFLNSGILGQHGGELLCHYSFYTPDLDTPRMKYMPGMIVAGTQLFFTLLEITGAQLRALTSKKDHKARGERAIVYYSEPKDVLKKDDRDLLIECLFRLNNVQL